MIPKIIHQVFLGQTESLEKYPNFIKNKVVWQDWCKENNWDYNFYDKNDVINLIEDEDLLKFYNNLTFNWQRIDFCRYIIINKFGGLYVDLDIEIKEPQKGSLATYILNQDYIIGLWHNKKTNKTEMTNSLIGYKSGELSDLIKYSISETKKKKEMEIYKTWKIRFFLQTTGVRMFNRWCKIKKYKPNWEIYKYLKDGCSATWLKNFN